MSSIGKLSPDIVAVRTVTQRLVLLLIGFFALAILLTRLPTFINAASGETWQIRGGQIPLMQYPAMPERSLVANRQLIVMLERVIASWSWTARPFVPGRKSC